MTHLPGLIPKLVIDINGILQLLPGFDAAKTVGPDGISPVLLKRCEAVAQYLFVIFSETLKIGMALTVWNMANVTSVFKSESKLNGEKYRPISITLIF